MNPLRCFIAVEVPDSIQAEIASATAAIRAFLGNDLVRWVPIGNVHLTLKFLGETASSALEQVRALMTAEASRFRSFDVAIEGFGAFPDVRRPRVLWVGLTAPQPLGSLQKGLDIGTARLGYPSEERGFSPHLTIGRVRPNLAPANLVRIRDAIHTTAVGRVTEMTVRKIHLFQSELLPSGSRYSRLFSVPFAEV